MIFIFSNPNYKNLYFIVPILIIWTYICLKKRKSIFRFYKDIISYVSNTFYFNWLSLLLLILLCFYALYLPLSYDESYTFLQFVDRNMFYPLCTYPVPNNHVLHSALSNISWHIFGWSNQVLFVRLPAIIASVLMLAAFGKKIAQKDVLIIGLFVVLLVLNLPFLSFSFQARGYSLQIFFAVISVFFIYHKSTNETFKFNNQSILLFSLMGLYTSPAYLYTFLSLYTLFFVRNLSMFKKNIPYIIYTTIIFNCTIILLYGPIMIFRGYKSIINNRFVRPLEQFDMPYLITHYSNSLIEVTGGKIIALIIFSLFLYFSIVKKRVHNILILLIPFLLMLILNQAPFSRVFLPLSFSIIVYVLWDLKKSNKSNTLKRQVISGVIVCFALAFSTYAFFKTPNGGLQSSLSVKYLSKYFERNIYLHENTHDYLKTAIIANLNSSRKPYKVINSSSELKKGNLIIFTNDLSSNIKVIDSTKSLDKKVFVGVIRN